MLLLIGSETAVAEQKLQKLAQERILDDYNLSLE